MKEERLQLTPQKYKGLLRNHYEEQYAKSFHNLGKIDKFLETQHLPKLSQVEAGSLNRPKTAHEVKAVVKKSLLHKRPVPPGFASKYYQTLREELTPIIFKLFQKIEE